MDQVRLIPLPERLHEPLRRALRGEAAAWPETLAPAEVDALIAHGVVPAAYAVSAHPQLRDEALRAAAAEPLRLADLREVLRSVDAMILKGTALAYDLYPAPELRPRADTDLLIRREELAQVRAAFLRLGFSERITSGDELGVRQAAFSRTDAFGVEHVYDVHWAVANSAVFADVLRRDELVPRPLPRISDRAFGLPDAEALLLACVHRVAHHENSQKLIWLVDIDRLRARMQEDEHARFWRLAAERRVVAVCAHSIETADAWLQREPRSMPLEVPHDEPSRAFLDRDISYGSVTLANLRALPWRLRFQRLRQLAFPPRAFMEQSFPSRSRLALPWLYLYRALRGIGRLFAKAGAR